MNGYEIKFNATGSKFSTLNDFIVNSERKRLLKHPDTSHSTNESRLLNIEHSISERKVAYLDRLRMESAMSSNNKMAIKGDELGFREAVNENGHIDTGRTALHDASSSGHTYMIRVICRDFVGDIEKTTTLGKVTALHLAVANGHRHVCYILIQQGANIKARDIYGNYPIHFIRNISVCKLLLSKNASLLVRNNAGLTPLQYYLKMNELQHQDPNLINLLRHAEEEERTLRYPQELSKYQQITGTDLNVSGSSLEENSDKVPQPSLKGDSTVSSKDKNKMKSIQQQQQGPSRSISKSNFSQNSHLLRIENNKK